MVVEGQSHSVGISRDEYGIGTGVPTYSAQRRTMLEYNLVFYNNAGSSTYAQIKL